MTSRNKPIIHVQSLFLKHSGAGNGNILVKCKYLQMTPMYGTWISVLSSIPSPGVCFYLWGLNQCSWASELARLCCRWQGDHLGGRGRGGMHNAEDTGTEWRDTLCPVSSSKDSHHPRSGVTHSLCTSASTPTFCLLLSETTCLH